MYGTNTMRIYLLAPLLALLFQNCSPDEPQLFEGTAEVIVNDGVTIDTLNSCYCWKATDSLGISIGRISFGGIRVNISERNSDITPSIIYYSDYDEFDGEFELGTELLSDQMSLKFKNLLDSIEITGNLNISARTTSYFSKSRTVTAIGNFQCKLNK